MKFLKLAVIALALLAASISISPAAQKATPCASLILETSPTTVAAGQPVTLSGSITNCSTIRERVTISYVVSGPCNYNDTYSLSLALKPGETRTASVVHAAPDCSGSYTITATVTSGSNYLTSTWTSFTVQ